jgi:hypothetical protein
MDIGKLLPPIVRTELKADDRSFEWFCHYATLVLLNLRWSSRRGQRTDRALSRRQRIEVDKHRRAHWEAQKRTGDALPKRVEQVIETGKALVTEAKGLGRR